MGHISDREKLQQVEEKIEKLYELLNKQGLTKREEYELKNFDEELRKLEADKKFWQGIIEKGIL